MHGASRADGHVSRNGVSFSTTSRALAYGIAALQGVPDGFTDIPWRGKGHAPDSPRYRAIGNGWATPVVRWIGERIAEHWPEE